MSISNFWHQHLDDDEEEKQNEAKTEYCPDHYQELLNM